MANTDSSPGTQRPLSPHLTIYRWPINMAMSITHRATGVALTVGTLLLTVWLCAAANSPECYAWLNGFFGGFIGKFMLFGWSVSLYYHMLNGIRHLWWDTGHGFELGAVMRSSWIVIAGTILLTVVTWIIAFSGGPAL